GVGGGVELLDGAVVADDEHGPEDEQGDHHARGQQEDHGVDGDAEVHAFPPSGYMRCSRAVIRATASKRRLPSSRCSRAHSRASVMGMVTGSPPRNIAATWESGWVMLCMPGTASTGSCPTRAQFSAGEETRYSRQ